MLHSTLPNPVIFLGVENFKFKTNNVVAVEKLMLTRLTHIFDLNV